jgi:hypothetical protein
MTIDDTRASRSEGSVLYVQWGPIFAGAVTAAPRALVLHSFAGDRHCGELDRADLARCLYRPGIAVGNLSDPSRALELRAGRLRGRSRLHIT